MNYRLAVAKHSADLCIVSYAAAVSISYSKMFFPCFLHNHLGRAPSIRRPGMGLLPQLTSCGGFLKPVTKACSAAKPDASCQKMPTYTINHFHI